MPWKYALTNLSESVEILTEINLGKILLNWNVLIDTPECLLDQSEDYPYMRMTPTLSSVRKALNVSPAFVECSGINRTRSELGKATEVICAFRKAPTPMDSVPQHLVRADILLSREQDQTPGTRRLKTSSTLS